jgi:hypothetical protein
VARLAIINNGKVVNTIELAAGDMFIGRGDDVAIQLKHPLISRRHAKVYLTSAGYIVEDQGTKNGTFVKGRRVQRHRLEDGDQIEVADFLLLYHADGFVPIDDEMPPAGAGGGGGMVARDRKAEQAKTPLQQYMEAMKRGGQNATAAIPPEAMAKLREQARKKATPRLEVVGGDTVPLESKETTVGWNGDWGVRLPGSWLWVKAAARFVRADLAVRVEAMSFWAWLRVNGKRVQSAELKPGDEVTIAGRVRLKLHEGDPGF